MQFYEIQMGKRKVVNDFLRHIEFPHWTSKSQQTQLNGIGLQKTTNPKLLAQWDAF